MNVEPVDHLPVDLNPKVLRFQPFWVEVAHLLDARPGTWHLVVRNGASNPATTNAVNSGRHPTLHGDLYAAHCHTRRVDGRLRHDLYLRRRSVPPGGTLHAAPPRA